eukprot:scaffold232_cov141-Skeletonema_menzelii.AAC.5
MTVYARAMIFLTFDATIFHEFTGTLLEIDVDFCKRRSNHRLKKVEELRAPRPSPICIRRN